MVRGFEVVKRIENKKEVKLPQRATANSAGYDFYAIERIEIPPYKIGDDPFIVKTGVKAYMLEGEFLLLANRSSNPKKKKLVIANSVGIIDADYYGNEDNDGEIMFAFYNLSNDVVVIEKGEKLGQSIFMDYNKVDNDTTFADRTGGFGSTGK